ncbi:hypothetical protein [Paenibacillus harenae]|uniref:Phage protein n=1 Tax=Paenibacillus harenae TaxID=306543 RepID=A0ABT9U329_PAEHA|nr:hypothetical protein [Paenibacillus harenae]MDQ0113471.1 hypothetical protein [Paenibacillus harenae]
MKQTLLIKHAVSGRMLIDSGKQDVSFSSKPEGNGWQIDIGVPWSGTIEEILKLKDELNVFIFYDYDDQPTLKTWYYVGKGPVAYDRDSQLLTIGAQSRIEYYPHEYSV